MCGHWLQQRGKTDYPCLRSGSHSIRLHQPYTGLSELSTHSRPRYQPECLITYWRGEIYLSDRRDGHPLVPLGEPAGEGSGRRLGNTEVEHTDADESPAPAQRPLYSRPQQSQPFREALLPKSLGDSALSLMRFLEAPC